MSTNLIGQILLNRYRVESFVASGGMGAVYRVWDTQRNVPLAMKVLHADLADDPSVFKRFEREARALQNLAHPNIVPFYGLHHVDDFVFILEQYIDGFTLQKLLRRPPRSLELGEALTYMKALCAALGYAHAHDVVHCDVKPGNVMINQGGQIYLADFGIARHAESTTTTMGAAGTPAYMAPEQIMGHAVTLATDVYALGVLFYELLTGQRPFRGTEKETESAGPTAAERIRYAHVQLPPPDPRLLNPRLPEGLVQVLFTALAKQPAQRYPNAPAFFIAICRSLGVSPESVPDRAPVPTEMINPPTDRSTGQSGRMVQPQPGAPPRPWWLWAGGGLAALIVLGLGMAFLISLLGATAQLPTEVVRVVTVTALPNGDISAPVQMPPDASSVPVGAAEIPAAQANSSPKNLPGALVSTATAAPAPTDTPVPLPLATDTPVPLPTATDTPEPPPTATSVPTETPDTRYPPACANPGETWISPVDGMQLACVPVGDAFWIDTTEVTNAMYQRCVQAGVCSPPYFDANASAFHNYFGSSSYNNYPVAAVSWTQAGQYCEWAGRRLPSQSEWKQAAGNKDGNTYPWGSGIDCGRANYNPDGNFCGIQFTTAVGSYPAGRSPYGAYDLAGNVFEWVNEDCSAGKTFMGGSWNDDASAARIDNAACRAASTQSSKLGFRCAY